MQERRSTSRGEFQSGRAEEEEARLPRVGGWMDGNYRIENQLITAIGADETRKPGMLYYHRGGGMGGRGLCVLFLLGIEYVSVSTRGDGTLEPI